MDEEPQDARDNQRRKQRDEVIAQAEKGNTYHLLSSRSGGLGISTRRRLMHALIDPDQDIDDRPYKVGTDDSASTIDVSQFDEGLLDIKSLREEKGQEREAEECHRHDSMEDEQWTQGAEEAFYSEKVDAPK